jgi:hypothetical protein
MKLLTMLTGTLLFLNVTHAAVIQFTLTDFGSGKYQYDYVVENDKAIVLDNFSLFFDVETMRNITVLGTLDNWYADVFQPDIAIPDNGFIDSYTYKNPLAKGESQTGLSVSFDWTGQEVPLSQRFEVYDSEWNLLEIGYTSSLAIVDEPATALLFSLGLIGLLASRQKKNLVAKEVL